MKKKLFFKLFIFAVIGSLATMTSCKDYDDDIDNLQEQIDQLATKSDVDTKLNALQTSLNTAQTNASNALTKAQEALTAAQAALAEAQAVGDAALTEAKVQEIADAKAKVEAAKVKVETLAALQEQIATLKAELQATNKAEFEAMKAEINASLAKITKKVEDALGLLAGAVFDVELVQTYSLKNQIPWITWDLTFSSATEQDNVFEEGIDNAITFVKGKQVQTSTSFVIRVSPTNVMVTPDMITLQNSKGVTYDNVEVTKVEPYEELLTRSTNGGGLWKVTVELKNYEKAAFEAATESNGKKVLFAVAVNNSDEDAPSKVISTYDLGLNWESYKQANGLSFKVDGKDVAEINNRYDDTSISLDKQGNGTKYYEEKKWKDNPATAPTSSNTLLDDADDRTDKNAYPAVQGQPIKIALNDPNNQIKAMYVTLDYEDNAIDSAPSEWNAWKSYSYTGLGKVVEGTETEIIINSNSAINDYIGFRVFAVNYDGTLVDPDGKAFYVSLGKEATTWNTLNTVVTATQEDVDAASTLSAKVNATLSKLTGATTYEWTTDKADDNSGTTPAFDVFFIDANGNPVFNTTSTSGSVTGVDFSKVAKAYTIAKVNNWLAYKDNKVYNGKLTIKNATGHVLATLNVTFKKVLPTAPEGFSVKTNQIGSDGIYRCYLEPNIWTAPNATEGTMSLNQVFNFGTGTVARYETIFAASKPKAGGGHDPIVVTGAGLLSVGKAYINNTTQHATKVVYNFGKISTETKDSNGYIDYKVTIEEFPTVYSNIYNSTYSWNWATKEQLNLPATDPLPYSTSITYGDTKTYELGWIYGVSSRDSKYNAFLSAPYKSSLLVESAKLVSNSNNLDEYFNAALSGTTISLTEKSGSTNPTADVPSTLVITAKDMYGNNVEIRLPMTVKKR
jgi:hypothetical protein